MVEIGCHGDAVGGIEFVETHRVPLTLPRGVAIRTGFAETEGTSAKSTFRTGVKTIAPWWSVQGTWVQDDEVNAAMVGAGLARRVGWRTGDEIEARVEDRTTRFRIIGIVNSGGFEEDQSSVALPAAQALMGLLTLTALGGSALAVMTAMTASVMKRRAEIGLMKALGVDGGPIALIFLSKAALIGLAGGAAGYMLGLGLAQGLGRWLFSVGGQMSAVVLRSRGARCAGGGGAGRASASSARAAFRRRAAARVRRPRADQSAPDHSGQRADRQPRCGQRGDRAGHLPPIARAGAYIDRRHARRARGPPGRSADHARARAGCPRQVEWTE